MIPAFVNSSVPEDIVTHLKRIYDNRVDAGEPSLDSFVAFAIEYLDNNRVVELFYADSGNIGLCLSNNVRVTTTRNGPAGTMQPSGAIGISSGVSQPGQNGVISAPALSIT
jgi:hypothetical protein